MNKLKEYKKNIKEVLKYDDKEEFHILRDEIYQNFIKDVSEGKIKRLKDIKEISTLINKKLIKPNFNLWFA